MKNYLVFALCSLLVISISAAEQTPREIMERCVKRHGGKKNFKKIKNIYIKMDVRSKTEKSDVESLVKQYFRFPNKLRAEINSMLNPPTKVGWDGKDAWQLTKDKLEKTSDIRQKENLKESLRFIKLIMLTSLLDQKSKLKYEKYIKRPSYGIHVISQTNEDDEELKIYVKDSDYSLYGGEFHWKKDNSIFKVFLAKQNLWVDGVCFPREARIYRGKEKVLDTKVRVVKINAIKNGNSFFSNLKEKVKMKKKKRSRRPRRRKKT